MQNVQIFQKISDRLRYIEFCLIYKGFITRGDLMQLFDLSEASATRAIREYIERSDFKNAIFNPETKANEITKDFSPLYDISDQEVFQWLQLESIDTTTCPLIYTFPFLTLPEQPAFSPIIRAIIEKKCVEIHYLSLNTGEKKRVIAPHAIFNDGLRLYIRTFDRDKNRFIHLHPARVVKATLLSETPAIHESAIQDNEWNEFVELSLIAHPKLNELEKSVIEYEYQMSRGKLKTRVRKSTANHFLYAWHVDCSETARLDHKVYHLWLENRESIADVAYHTAPGYFNAPSSL